jgi:pimeloyl-ACP methyl ester carboxylesterase
VDTPATRYARSADGTFIAFQVFGNGPDLLVAFPWISHLELFWEDPDVGPWLRSLARFARVISMDQRGIGLSDRMTQLIDLETKVDDVRAVLDAAGSKRTTLYGQGVDGGAICSMFAATYPERTAGLLLWSADACGRSQPDYPWGPTEAEEAAFFELIADTWGDQEVVGRLMDEVGLSTIAEDPVARKRWARTMRNAASRGDALIHERMFADTDFRGILPSIHVPTSILQREWTASGWTDVAAAEWMASQVPGAKLVRFPAEPDYPPYLGDTRSNLEAVEEFLASVRQEEAEFDRVLATVLFTDIIGSTEKAAELGDRAWKELLERHHGTVRALLGRYRGTEIDTAGDGFFATFDGPARAIRCAQAIRDAVRTLGVEVRCGGGVSPLV